MTDRRTSGGTDEQTSGGTETQASGGPEGHETDLESDLETDSGSGERFDREPRRTASLEGIREIYADQADQMERFAWCNQLFTGRYRRRLFGRAEGRVLDVACGTGLNCHYLPDDVEYVGVDVSPEMLEKTADRLASMGVDGRVLEMDAQDLTFEDDSFDAVISSLSTCTFPDPVAALREIDRVCAPGGQILLLEHGRSSVGPIARFQDWRADAHFEKHACRWNQEPLAVVSSAGLEVRDATTAVLGVITAIRAAPA